MNIKPPLTPHPPRRFVFLRTTRKFLALALLVFTLLCVLPSASSEENKLADPVPIRRVTLPPDKLAAELERAKRGVLVQMPRQEFEDRVRRAAETVESLKNPPRLVEAHYIAKLVDTALVGTAAWKIVNPLERPGILPVQPLNLALSQARWSDNREAVIAELQPNQLGLLVDPVRQCDLLLDWSARSIPAPPGLRFSLDVPGCPIASLELDLPADYQVDISRETYLLAGPLPAADAGRRTWRIAFAGRSNVVLDIRRVSGPGLPPPLVLTKSQITRLELTPGQLQADFDFELKVLHGGVRTLRCECPVGLRPSEVTVRGLESWQLLASPGKGAPATLLIKLREPSVPERLQVRCLAPLPSGSDWSAPSLRIAGAVSSGETMHIRVHPGVQLENWQLGNVFRLTRSSFQPDGWQVMTLTAGLDPDPTPTKGVVYVRPSARVQVPGPEYKVRQYLWWQVDPDRPTLSAQLNYELLAGRLFSLPVTLPTGWEIEQVDVTPADLLQNWTLGQDKGKTVLTVDLQRSLDAATPARLNLRLRPNPPFKPLPTAQTLPIPDVVPAGARVREGALGISIGTLYQATANASLPAFPQDAGDDTDGRAAIVRPWSKQALDYYFPFQGQPAEGTLTLRPRAPQVRARCTCDVVIATGRVITRLELRPEIGTSPVVELFISDGAVGPWEWKTVRGANTVSRFERNRAADLAPFLAVIGARQPLQAVTAMAIPLRGEWWRLTFAQPLREPVIIEAEIEMVHQGAVAKPQTADGAARQRRWAVPLVTVPAADRIDGMVTLHLAGSDKVQVESEGLREVVEAVRSDREQPGEGAGLLLSPAGSSWRTFRFGHPPLSLTLNGGTSAVSAFTEAVVDHAGLTSQLGPDGRLLHRFRFQLANWQQSTLPVRLPSDVKLEGVRINGRWLDRLPSGETTQGTRQHELPVLPGMALHRFEIVYSNDLPRWSLWTTLPAPVPELPVQIVSLRRIWQLSAGVAPLAEGSLLAVPGGEESRTAPAAEYRGSEGRPSKTELTDGVNRQEQELSDAVAALRKAHQPEEEWQLAQVLHRLVFDHFKDQPLIVDVRALRAARLGRNTVLPAAAWEGAQALTPLSAPWESVGLVHVPCRPAVVLTTRQQLAVWQTASGGSPGRWIEDAVAEAVAFGHDRSGRFRSVPDWLQMPDTLGPASWESTAATETIGVPDGNWTEWETLAGTDGDSLIVVRPGPLPFVGVVLALGLIFAALRFGPATERRRRRIILPWLAVAGLAVLWLPPAIRVLALGPAMAGLGVAVLWIVRSVLMKPTLAKPQAALLAVLLMVAGLHGEAPAPAGPSTVYLVSNSEDGTESVLVPPALLGQLEAMERRGLAGLRGAVLLSAVYDGRADHASASFDAKFHVYNFAEEATVTLPLTNILLNEAQLDNAPAFLGPRNTLRITGRGMHTVLLRFNVLVGGAGDEAELRLGIPELPMSRLTLRVPGTSGYLYAVDDERAAKGIVPSQARGAQSVDRDGNQLRLRAQLGAVKTVAVRWRKDEPAAPVVSVKEAYYWDLQASSARLLAVLQYTVTKGWQKTFELDLPGELEVASVEAGPLIDGLQPPRLQEWLLRTDGGRRLRLEFHTPLTHGVQVTLELVPRTPFTRTAVLPFPTPLDARQSQGFLGYRIEGLEASVAQHHAITGDKKELLDRAFIDSMAKPWRKARDEDLREPTRSYWRAKGGVLHLILRPPVSQTECVQEVSWRIAPRQALLRASAKITSPEKNLAMIEWDIPPGLQIIDVAGSQVHGWTRFGPRLQVWLTQPTAEAAVQVTGWLPRATMNQAQFNLPAVRIVDMRKQRTSLQLTGEALTLTASKLTNLTPRPELTAPGRELSFETEQDGYSCVVQTSPAVARADFQLLTFAEVQERNLVFTASLRGTVRQGELRNLTVSLRNWEGGDVTLLAPEVARSSEKRLGSMGRTWSLELKPGVAKEYHLTLTGKLPLGSLPAVFLPDIRVESSGGESIKLERWIAMAGPELTAESAVGLTPIADAAAAMKLWPREAERVRRAQGSLWRIATDDWRLRLRPQTLASRAAGVQVFLTEQAASVSDGRRWLHQATYWVYHEAGADLTAVMPPGASLLSVAIDDVSVLPMQPGSDRLWLPLPGGAGVRTVRLSWTMADGKERFDVPSLASPRLDGVTDGPAVWVVASPAGYQDVRRSAAGRTADEIARPISAVSLDLTRAAAQLHLLGFLLEQARETTGPLAQQVTAAEERFEQFSRRAEYELALQPTSTSNGPDGQPLAAWLAQLRDENQKLTRTPAFERIKAEIKPTDEPPPGVLWSVSPLERGRPLYWQAATGQAIPLLRLMPDDSIRNRQAWTLATLLAFVLFASWILSQSFRRSAWPEQLALVGCVGVMLFGAGWGQLFLLLPAVWVIVRLAQLAIWIQMHLPMRRQPEPVPQMGSAVVPPPE